MHLISSVTAEGFFLGPFYFYTWGLMAAIGILAAAKSAKQKFAGKIQLAEKTGFSENQLWFLTIILTLSVFLGARVLYIFENWSYYSIDPLSALKIWEGGFSFSGGALAGILVGYGWSKLKKFDLFLLGFFYTPAWIYGIFFGRLGCFIIHDHLGKTTDLPWGIWIQGAYRHEPALYEAIWLLLLGVGLSWWERQDGQPNYNLPASWPNKRAVSSKKDDLARKNISFRKILFPLSLLLYSWGRFFIDFVRADDARFYGLTIAQWFCVLLIIVSAEIIINTRTYSRRNSSAGSELSRQMARRD